MEELIEKSKQGDKEAFTQIIITIELELYKIAKTRLVREEDIEDAVQETILEAFRNIKKLKSNNFFKTWIIRILINKCNDIYKKNKKFNHVSIENIEDNKYCIETRDCNLEDSNLDFEILISRLQYKERIILVLYYLEDFTIKQIGKILLIPASTVKNRLSRARNKLKDFIESEDYV